VSVLLRFDACSYRYPGVDRPALAGVTLEVGRGEVVAVVGDVGAGTSTLLLVAGGYAPRLLGGVLEGTRASAALRPAIVFATPWTQLTGLYQTVRGEVAFGPASFGWTRERVLARVGEALAQLGAADLAGRDPVTLSGGELQRVIVAGALAMEPDLLLLDDPAAEFDPSGADALYALLPRLAATGVTVLVATPDLDRVARVASRAVRLDAGRIVGDGSPAEVLA
jgi:energy-coupling factor transporter ATP-binding protein EcfA2